jgi:hypothetical protein
MTAADILEALGLDYGMREEWDCSLANADQYGMLAGSEVHIAARSGATLARYHQREDNE